MAPTTHPLECTYLHSHTLPTTHTSSEHAEFIIITQRIITLDRHISELNTLRHALHYRSCQLHNMFSPIYTLPIEVLSRIFEQLFVSPQVSSPKFDRYRACLSQAFVLGSVSARFRHVALGTPELWKRIPLRISCNTIGKASSLLQHCMALTANINISVIDNLYKEEARSAVDILLTSDTMPKIKAFELYNSTCAQKTWIKKLKACPSPMLDALSIKCPMRRSLDFGVFKNVTQLVIDGPCRNDSLTIVAPPSLQYLTASDVPQRTLVSLLYQSPNLVECFMSVRSRFLSEGAIFDEPLTLSHLTRLTLWGIKVIMFSPQVLLLPSLKSLSLQHHGGTEFIGVILLCQNTSATLTVLKIKIRSDTVKCDDLRQLWKIPFPNLRTLILRSSQEPSLGAVELLTLWVNEYSSTEPHYLPSLSLLLLRSSSTIETRCVLDLLKKWKIGEVGHFNVKVRYPRQDLRDWSTELREELGSIVGNRQIDVIWGDNKVLPLSREAGSIED